MRRLSRLFTFMPALVLGLTLSTPAFAKTGKFKLAALGTPEELTLFCNSKGFKGTSASGQGKGYAYVVCSDEPEIDLGLKLTVQFVDRKIHDLGAILDPSENCGPEDLKALGSSGSHTAASEFRTWTSRNVREIPLVNPVNQAAFAADASASKDLVLLKSPLNMAYGAIRRRMLSDDKDGDSFDQHNEDFIPIVGSQLKEFESWCEGDREKLKVVDFLKREFEYRTRQQQVSLNWVTGLPARFLAGVSKPSEIEKQVYAHVLAYPKQFSSLVDKGNWQRPEAFFRTLDSRVTDKSSNSGRVNYGADEIILRMIGREPNQFPLIRGKNFLSPLTLTAAYLHREYPVVMPRPNSKLQAHGIGVGGDEGLSSFGHFFHDVFHSKAFSESVVLESSIKAQASRAVEKGGDAEKFIAEHAPGIAKRHQGMLNLYKVVLDTLMYEHQKGAKTDEETKRFKSAVAGMFLGIHEFPALSEEMVEEKSASKVMQAFRKNVLKTLESRQSWESTENPLATSGKDGSSAKTDQEIIQGVLGELGLTEAYISSAKVLRSKHFIDVEVTYKNASKKTVSFPTFYHRLKNSEDGFALMKYAGQAGAGSLLARLHDEAVATPEDTQKVKEYLEQLRRTMKRTVLDFEEAALTVIQKPTRLDDATTSLEDQYKKWASAVDPSTGTAKDN